MSDMTNDTERPNRPEEGADARVPYIEFTRGLWVRQNRANDELEIWFNGELQAAWTGADEINGRLTTLLRYAFDMGKREQKREAGPVVTTNVLADALDCFWNAALGHTHRNQCTSLATDTVGAHAEGFAAIAARLRES